jgi:hypothetical protein
MVQKWADGGLILMTTKSETAGPGGQKPTSAGMGSFLFILVITFILFLLAQGMVRHRFHRGRHIEQPTPQATIPIGP